MKFIVSSTSLLKELQHIVGVIGTNTVLPILEDFLFDINKNTLTVIGTDLETVMKVELEINSNESGKVCIPAKILIDTLKNIPNQPLTIDIDNSFGIIITSDTGKYKVMGENPNNFPKEPSDDNTSTFTINAKALFDGINKTVSATSTSDLRPAMTGVLFEINPDNIQFIATDAHRLVKYRITGTTDVTFLNNEAAAAIIVPKKPLNLLKNSLTQSNEDIKLNFNENHLFAKFANIELSCRLIDARFPDYKVVLPEDNPYILNLNKDSFQNSLRRLTIYSNKSTNQVVLTISGSELQLTSQDIDLSFEGNERMTCSYTGEDLAIAFNAKLLIDLLQATESEEINIELSTSNKAGVIKPLTQEENEDLVMLIMPLMIN